MKINSYVTKMKIDEARKIASNKGNILGRLMLKNKGISEIKTLYIENKILVFNMTYEPNALSKSILKKSEKKQQKIKLIANGSTGGVSYYESGPDIKKIDVSEDNIQLSAYEDDVIIERGKRLARRIVRRQIGGNVSLELVGMESVYRPYYVAFYGELKEGTKVRYLPIAADGCQSKRTF